MKYLIEQQTILFYQRILRGSSPILRVLLQVKQGFVSSLLVKYNIVCPKHVIKSRIWDSFLTRLEIMDISIIRLGETVYIYTVISSLKTFTKPIFY